MKLSIEQLRNVIRESLLRGIPTFVIMGAVDVLVESLRKHVKQHIYAVHRDEESKRNAVTESNIILDELREEMNDLVQSKLIQFIQKI